MSGIIRALFGRKSEGREASLPDAAVAARVVEGPGIVLDEKPIKEAKPSYKVSPLADRLEREIGAVARKGRFTPEQLSLANDVAYATETKTRLSPDKMASFKDIGGKDNQEFKKLVLAVRNYRAQLSKELEAFELQKKTAIIKLATEHVKQKIAKGEKIVGREGETRQELLYRMGIEAKKQVIDKLKGKSSLEKHESDYFDEFKRLSAKDKLIKSQLKVYGGIPTSEVAKSAGALAEKAVRVVDPSGMSSPPSTPRVSREGSVRGRE